MRPLHEFRVSDRRAKITPFLKDAFSVTFAENASMAFVTSSYGGWFVSELDPKRALRLKARHFDGVSFSADGRRLATVDDYGASSVYDSKGSRLWHQKRTGGSSSVAFVGNALHYWDGCQLLAFADLSARGQALTQPSCGIVEPSLNGRRWSRREPTYGGEHGVFAHDFLEPATGGSTTLTGDDGFIDARLDPTGRYACLTSGEGALECADLDTGSRHAVSLGPVQSVEYSASGNSIIYAVGAARWSEKDFFLYDLEQRSSRFLLRSGASQLRFLPGEKRLLRTDGIGPESLALLPDEDRAAAPGATLYDLDEEWQLPIWDDGEIDGFSAIPGDSKRFLIGRERDATRDMYLVELPN